MMDKNSSLNKVCTWCENPALLDTDPPACEEHIGMIKKAHEDTVESLKELESK